MRQRILTPDDSEWLDLLARCPHDFYHLPGYVRLESERLGGEPVAVVSEGADGFALLPLVVRSFSIGQERAGVRLRDAISPYGYPSPLLGGRFETDRELAAAGFRLLVNTMRDLDCCTAFVRLHPILPVPGAPLRELGVLVTHGETVWMDLNLSEEELWRQVRESTRRKINKLKRKGVTARIDYAMSRMDDFVTIYRETMLHVGAHESYHFSSEYFHGLRHALPRHMVLCIVESDGEMLAGGLFAECCKIVQYHLGGTASRHRDIAPSHIMFDFVRSWAKSRDNHRFHLGGGLGGARDSLFQFKSGFSKLRSPFATWRLVLQPDLYRLAVAEWERLSGESVAGPEAYFPPYRQPVP